MSVVANTFITPDAVGVREELSDMIYDISPEDTPVLTGAGRGKAKTTFFEWQTDELADADGSNAQLEGDDVQAFDAVDPTVRIGNYQQISRKTVVISDTEEVVDKAGRKSELAYQIAKRSKELKRDMEKIICSNQGAVAGATATARKTGSLLAFIKTNVSLGATGTNPVYTNIPTDPRNDGTQRAFTEDLLKEVISDCWASGASPKEVQVGAFNKQAASAFDGIATKFKEIKGNVQASIIGAADVYVSDFGQLSIVPNRFMRTRDALVLDFDYVSVNYLRPFKTTPLAKTGDAEKRMLITEWGLKVGNEKALGLVADLTTS